MNYNALDYSKIIGTPGFSNDLLNTHFGLYEGYVKNTNGLLEKLQTLDAGSAEYKELRRRLGWEFNGMRLHELYFGGMTKDNSSLPKDSALYKKMADTFGEAKGCHDDFIKTASLRGVGWVITYFDPIGDRILNTWVDDHATNHLSGCTPLIVMDMWEHAFVADYGMNKADYIKAYVNAIDWQVVQNRFKLINNK